MLFSVVAAAVPGALLSTASPALASRLIVGTVLTGVSSIV